MITGNDSQILINLFNFWKRMSYCRGDLQHVRFSFISLHSNCSHNTKCDKDKRTQPTEKNNRVRGARNPSVWQDMCIFLMIW